MMYQAGMSRDVEEIRSVLREHILTRYLPGEDPGSLEDSTPLVSGGILDSIALLNVVSFLEDRFGIEFAPHETTGDSFDTVAKITALVESKRHPNG